MEDAKTKKADHHEATLIANEVRAGSTRGLDPEAALVVCEAYADLQKKIGAFRESSEFFRTVPMPSPELP